VFNWDITRSVGIAKGKQREWGSPWLFRSGEIKDITPEGYYDKYMDMFPPALKGDIIGRWLNGVGGTAKSKQTLKSQAY